MPSRTLPGTCLLVGLYYVVQHIVDYWKLLLSKLSNPRRHSRVMPTGVTILPPQHRASTCRLQLAYLIDLWHPSLSTHVAASEESSTMSCIQ